MALTDDLLAIETQLWTGGPDAYHKHVDARCLVAFTAMARNMSRDELHYRALSARDPRFDGLFFVGVSSTGIYCRPICPARLPKRSNCSFYQTAAQAELAGYRACFRCRPELSPGNATVDKKQSLVDRAVIRINAGALNEGSVADLAAGLGVGERHLRRAVSEQLGATPVALAQSRRLALAKQLLTDTDLGLAAIAHASGFGSGTGVVDAEQRGDALRIVEIDFEIRQQQRRRRYVIDGAGFAVCGSNGQRQD